MADEICEKKRPSWDEYFMNIAQLVATRSTCNRGVDLKYLEGFKGVGAIIVKDRVILATGYNGSPRGLDHCDDVGHEIVEGHCVRTVHGEANALASAAKYGVTVDKATVYTTASPCYDCFKLLINAGISRIVCGSFYGSRYGASEKVLTLAAQAGIKMEFLKTFANKLVEKKSDEDTIFIDANDSSSHKKQPEVPKGWVLKIKKLHPSAKAPEFARDGDAGLDLFAIEGVSIAPGARVSVPIGIAMEIPDEYVGMIWDRTGMSLKKGLKVIGGVFDSSYRGEVKVLLANISSDPVEIMQGDKVAQMVIQPFERPEIEITDELSETDRGDKMFGSSDVSVSEELAEPEEPAEEDYKALDNILNIKEEVDDESRKSRW